MNVIIYIDEIGTLRNFKVNKYIQPNIPEITIDVMDYGVNLMSINIVKESDTYKLTFHIKDTTSSHYLDNYNEHISYICWCPRLNICMDMDYSDRYPDICNYYNDYYLHFHIPPIFIDKNLFYKLLNFKCNISNVYILKVTNTSEYKLLGKYDTLDEAMIKLISHYHTSDENDIVYSINNVDI